MCPKLSENYYYYHIINESVDLNIRQMYLVRMLTENYIRYNEKDLFIISKWTLCMNFKR